MSDGSVVFMNATDSDWKSDFLTLPRMEESRTGHVTTRIFGVGGAEPNIKSALFYYLPQLESCEMYGIQIQQGTVA